MMIEKEYLNKNDHQKPLMGQKRNSIIPAKEHVLSIIGYYVIEMGFVGVGSDNEQY